MVAGSKLRELVVDTKDTASAILKHGNLARRTTITPLDTVTAHCLTAEQVTAARALVGPDNVAPAIDLVGFDANLRPAMEHAFGSSFVCKVRRATATALRSERDRVFACCACVRGWVRAARRTGACATGACACVRA